MFRLTLSAFSAVALVACPTAPVAPLPTEIATYIDPDVTRPAEAAHFHYVSTVQHALAGDRQALLTLVEFSPRLASSPSGAEFHGGVLAQLYERLGPGSFREVFARASPQSRESSIALMRAMSYHPDAIQLR